MVARCKIQVYFSAEHAHIGINSAPTAPGCRRMKHRVLWVLLEVNSILRPRMTDCILLPIAIGLIEQMNFVIQHNGSWCGNAVRLAQRILLYFAAGCPMLHIGRFRNADAEPSILMPQGIIEPVTAAIADNSRILGETKAICIGKQHDKSS